MVLAALCQPLGEELVKVSRQLLKRVLLGGKGVSVEVEGLEVGYGY